MQRSRNALWTSKRCRRISALVLLMTTAASTAAGARPISDDRLAVRSGALTLGADDVFISDGSGVYAKPSDLDAYLYDDRIDEPDVNDPNRDSLWFTPRKESYSLASEFVDGDATTPGAQPVRCATAEIDFFSEAHAHWIETLQPSGSIAGDARAICFEVLDGANPRGYIVGYRDPTDRDCSTLTRVDEVTYRVAAGTASIVARVHVSGCAAVVHAFEIIGGEWHYRFLGIESSPLELSVTLQKPPRTS